MDSLGTTDAARLDLLDDAPLVRTFLPMIRNDYRLSETYRPSPGAGLRTPVIVLYGDQDPEITAAEAQGWREVPDAGCAFRTFEGGHFYLDEPGPTYEDQVVGGLDSDTGVVLRGYQPPSTGSRCQEPAPGPRTSGPLRARSAGPKGPGYHPL
ncbi:thioesterase domain-containing protein [Streptomyces parvus]|uniref:thioesterase II family protein n=1 Tax=Streptomyces parvus TaxID=66428 RepID=UPI0028B0D13A|nr:thioesterase domain-containing protein [Streptomyces parvus]